jgi:MFS family permease
MNVVYAPSAYPAGALSDRFDRWVLLASGFVVLIVADLVLAFASGIGTVMIGVALWGLHMGMTQGLLTALIGDTAPAVLRGTAFGLFHLVSGGALLLASLIAGMLWDRSGPQATFLTGAVFTTIGLVGGVMLARRGGISSSYDRVSMRREG